MPAFEVSGRACQDTDAAGNTGTSNTVVYKLYTTPPTLEPDRAHVQEGHSVTADAAHGVLANDSDPIPNDALNVSEVNGQASNVGIAVAGAYGKLTLNANGGYTYLATANDHALPSDGVGLDTFTYTAKDGAGGAADTTLSVVVTAPGITYLGGTANTTIHGGNNVHQVLDGGAGNDVVIAGTGTQVLIGGPGDTLTAGHGADTFVFPPNFGNETITNFDVHHDTIQLPHSEFANVAAVLADIRAGLGNLNGAISGVSA
jgi:VCBS repeat-containing protein